VLGQNNGTFLAASINRNSPAERAGVQPQDQILTVDGTPVSGQSIESVVNRIRGPAGTVVNIGFRRGAQEFSLAIRRRQINL
jgi:carboxyl-terminal processing protease